MLINVLSNNQPTIRRVDRLASRQGTHLHAMILLVAYVDESEGVGGDAPGIIESTVGGALGAEGPQEAAGRIQHLNPVVVAVRDDVLPDPVYGYPGEAIELALAAAIRSELLHEVPITVKYLRTERRAVVYIGSFTPILKSASHPTAITRTRNFPPYLIYGRRYYAGARKILKASFSFTRAYPGLTSIALSDAIDLSRRTCCQY